jgi:uncharacterized protein
VLKKPVFQLIYKGKDISSELDPHTTEITYSDELDGKADEIEVSVQDKDGLWRGEWCPETGDKCELFIGYEGESLTPCGTFEIDEPESSGDRSGDVFSFSGQSVPVSKSARTTKTKAYEKKSLKQIAEEVAGDLDMTIVGTPPDMDFERQTQRRERPLQFLSRLASSYGAYFSVKGDKMVFAKREEVHEREAVRTIKHGGDEKTCEYISYSLKKTSDDTYSKGKLGHYDAHKNKHHKGEEEDDDVKNGETLRLDERVENEKQGKARIKSELEKKNLKAMTASFSFPGDNLLVAGQMLILGSGFGKWAGKFVIMKSRHKFSRGGYTTDIELGKPKAKDKKKK